MKELKLGIIRISELAEWFGIGKPYLSKKKKEKLEELKGYCKYEILDSTKISIIEIYKEYYIKPSIYNIIYKHFEEYWKGEGSLSAILFIKDFGEVGTEDTIKNYFCQIAREKGIIRRETRKDWKEEYKDKGIYGIYLRGELVYIGKTIRSFNQRFQEHWDGIKKGEGMYVYKQLHGEDYNEIEMKPLIRLGEIKVDKELSNRDVESMELAAIMLYKPKFNREGIERSYKLT